jgi:predicted AAA+ superfamily ATPase
MINRNKIRELEHWRQAPNRLPLIVQGARQVGKTYLLKQFATQSFNSYHYFNFEMNPKLKQLFELDLDPEKILQRFSLISGVAVGTDDLIFFDEIQECPAALTALKYFAESRPSQPVIAAGSLLGVALAGASFPVGKVSHLWLGPCTFEEYLSTIPNQNLRDGFTQAKRNLVISPLLHNLLWQEYIYFSITGGLPGAVSVFAEHRTDIRVAFSKVHEKQNDLLRDYRSDFSKYSEKENAVHIRAIFESVPTQLATVQDGSTKKFKFTGVIPNRKGFAELQHPINWLVNAGLISRVPIAKRAELPLATFSEDSVFKLYMFDTGILAAQAALPPQVIGAESYGITKGYFAENLALQGLRAATDGQIFCWMEGKSEIEFITLMRDQIVPIEVKSGQRTQSKSLASYIKRYRPNLAIKLSAREPFYDRSNRVWNLPLYLAGNIGELELAPR